MTFVFAVVIPTVSETVRLREYGSGVALAVVTEAVTAPALIVVGVLMAASLKHVAWDRFETAVPAFLTVLLMPLTYSIATGIALGFIAYPITMLAARRHREIHPLMIALAVVFLGYFLFLRP